MKHYSRNTILIKDTLINNIPMFISYSIYLIIMFKGLTGIITRFETSEFYEIITLFFILLLVALTKTISPVQYVYGEIEIKEYIK